MNRTKWLKRGAAAVLALVAANLAVDAALRTRRLRQSFLARFEKAFGRPVEVGRIQLRLVPTLRLEAKSVTVAESPEFGQEYFLRAERVTAGLRWTGLLRGKIEFGAFSFTRPSLNVVRNAAGEWNVSRWLPPAAPQPTATGAPQKISGAEPSAAPLDLVEFDEGRINFKREESKLAFALTNVTGKVEQRAPGKWTLHLEAQPWRSGTLLQTAGRITVAGQIAGTLARLQPAELHLRWDSASLADLMRLSSGQDFGLRGEAALEAVARSGEAPGNTGDWSVEAAARVRAIHRWDLPQRSDNPAISLFAAGKWEIPASELQLTSFSVEAPRSNARGEASFSYRASPEVQVRILSAGIQAADLLAWYRGFHAGVAEEVVAEGYLTGAAVIGGWPLTLRNLAFSSAGGSLRVPGISTPLRVGAFSGGKTRRQYALETVWVGWSPAPRRAPGTGKKEKRAAQRKTTEVVTAEGAWFAATQAVETGKGAATLEGGTARAENVLALAAALGRPLERGWSGHGAAAGSLRWEWQGSPRNAKLSGQIDFSDAEIQVAGLNQPVALRDARMAWKQGRREAHLRSAAAFGAEWQGDIEEAAPNSAGEAADWKFQLQADRLSAAELDRWVGPRARPGWLLRLLPSLLGGAARGTPAANATQLLRRIRAEGEIQVGELGIGKVILNDLKARASLKNFRLTLDGASAEYAGGTVRGGLQAEFSAPPRYKVDAKWEKLLLSQLAGAEKGAASLWEGTTAGDVRLSAEGVGRDALLKSLEGRGRVQFRNVGLKGCDVTASLARGAVQPGATRWPFGEGEFTMRQGELAFTAARLGGTEKVALHGKVSFGRAADLEFVLAGTKTGAARVLKLRGELGAPKISIEERR